MVSAINSALSGFAAAAQRLNVSANNFANADSTQTQNNGVVSNTPYVPQVLEQASQTTGGVTTHTQDANPPSISVYDPSNAAADANGITQYPNVDTAQQLVNAKIASYDAQGNLAVIKVQDKLFKSVLDIVS
jgi:flagellar basal-body rod protein FlgC